MSTSNWTVFEPGANDTYSQTLLKHLLRQMMAHFGVQGGCIALFDESTNQMKIHAHMVQMTTKTSRFTGSGTHDSPAESVRSSARRATMKLLPDLHASSLADRRRQAALSPDDFTDVTPQQSALLAVGTAYSKPHDLIGYAWHTNDAFAMRHEDYLTSFHGGQPISMPSELIPQSYLAVPMREAVADPAQQQSFNNVLGVIILYQITSSGSNFPRLRSEALEYVERVALYLQNDALQRAQRRASEYLQLLQGISNTFPSSVKLSSLVDSIYHFVTHVVDVSSMLLTLYDRDLDRLYDVFALRNGERIEGIVEQPRIMHKEERPVWWKVTQQEKRTLQFSPARESHRAQEYQELLTGIWGDQHEAESFLLLPMKMFNRVIGSLCITSKRPHAYHREEIQVLETMTQIATVGIENAKLYERDREILHQYRRILQEARQREAELAGINSALQSISTVLDVTELLNSLVESVAALVKVEICVFFQPSATQGELVARALYGLSSVRMVDDGSGMPTSAPPKRAEHDLLINLIQLPFKDTFLEQMTQEGFFYLQHSQLEELAQKSNEGGAIFLRETGIQDMLLIPLSYHTEFIGFLAVPTPASSQPFRPKDVSMLLAICAQAAIAIRNAQLFEQRAEAYAELERMNKLKDEFLVTASHELRTPLTAISGYSSQLKRQSARANPQQVLRFATKIHVAAQQLGDLVANMTEAAQVSTLDKKMQIEPVQLLSATEIATNMLTLSSEQNVSLDIASDIWINGDGPRIRQVLTNLLENASKYSPPESPISVSATVMPLSQIQELLSEDQIDPTLLLEREDCSMVLVRVKDQGEGILPDDQAKIFEKFVRAPRSLTTPVRGSGLGLYICRRFVEAMGGKLWLEQSVPNEGSTFSFYLSQVEAPVDVRE